MKIALNTIAAITIPVWWPIMACIECVQIAFGADLSKLLGPAMYEKLSK